MYEYGGIVNGKRIDLDEVPPLEQGTRVRVNVTPESTSGMRRGSPEALLSLVGTLSDDEAETMLRTSRECRQIDRDLWSDPP